MHPKFTSQSNPARSSITGKSITLAEACSMLQRSSHSGAPAGVRFMKKNFPRMPFGYLFITIARWARW